MSGRHVRWGRVCATAVAIAVVVLPLSACATPQNGPGAVASASPTGTPDAFPSDAPTPSVSPTSTDEQSAAPSEDPAPAPSASSSTITVTIANSGSDEQGVFASGLVTGATGEDGTCILTATSTDGRVLEAQAAAHATPAALNCGIMRIAAAPGDWSLVLSFSSSASTGSSEPVAVRRS